MARNAGATVGSHKNAVGPDTFRSSVTALSGQVHPPCMFNLVRQTVYIIATSLKKAVPSEEAKARSESLGKAAHEESGMCIQTMRTCILMPSNGAQSVFP